MAKAKRRTTKGGNILPVALAGVGAYLLFRGSGAGVSVTGVRFSVGNLVFTTTRTKPHATLWLTIRNNTPLPVPIESIYAEIFIPAFHSFAVGKFEAYTPGQNLIVLLPGQSTEIGVQGGILQDKRGNLGTGDDKKYYADSLLFKLKSALIDGNVVGGALRFAQNPEILIKGFIGYNGNTVRVPFERRFLFNPLNWG